MSITVIYHGMSLDRTVGLSVIYHGMSLTVLYVYHVINHCDTPTVQSETYRDKSLIDVRYGQRHAVINHCDRRTVQSETYRDTVLYVYQ
jgi:hypothetical protein